MFQIKTPYADTILVNKVPLIVGFNVTEETAVVHGMIGSYVAVVLAPVAESLGRFGFLCRVILVFRSWNWDVYS